MRDAFETVYVFDRIAYYSQHRVDTFSFAPAVLLNSQIEISPPPPPPPVLTAITHKNSVKVTLEQATKAQRGSRGIILLFLYPRGGWSTPRSGRFTTGKGSVPIVEEAGRAPGPACTAPTEIRFPYHPSRSESLYRLSHRGPAEEFSIKGIIWK